MYIDKDTNGNFSIMEMTRAEMSDLGAMLREFEYLTQQSNTWNDKLKARMVMASAKWRFAIIDALK